MLFTQTTVCGCDVVVVALVDVVVVVAALEEGICEINVLKNKYLV